MDDEVRSINFPAHAEIPTHADSVRVIRLCAGIRFRQLDESKLFVVRFASHLFMYFIRWRKPKKKRKFVLGKAMA